MNNLLLVISIIGVFTALLMTKKLFGKSGLIAWIGIATILAEIGTIKQVNVLGLSGTLGNILFASNFLATDILTEDYGEKTAKKGVKFGIFAVVLFVIIVNVMTLYIPNELDFAQDSFKTLFTFVPRICISSIVMLSIANLLDVKLYACLKRKTKGKYMWLRNNLSTILCNGIENFIFVILSFVGIYSIKDMLSIAVATTIIETIIALCDTPFLYLSKRIKGND